MVKKMKFVNIMGPKQDINRVKEVYISKYDIQVEDAVKEMSVTNKNISFLSITNPLIDALKNIEKIAENMKVSEELSTEKISEKDALSVIEEITSIINDFDIKRESLEREKSKVEALQKDITPFTQLDFSIDKLFKFNFIKFRFGRIPISSYKQFKSYLYTSNDVLFQESFIDENYVWCIYFVPRTIHEKTDAIFASLYFERIRISSELHGKPSEAYKEYHERLIAIDEEIKCLNDEKHKVLSEKKTEISNALKCIRDQYKFYEMQKSVGKTKDDFYIIVGWMAEKDALALAAEAKTDDDVVVIVKDDSTSIKSTPPTKLSNFILFRPFELFVQMYGLPSYNEIDPTPFLGITYTILFGIMFGDLGQGLVLSLFGYFLYKVKKIAMGSILCVIGLSSAFFGLMFGSVFGYENLLTPIWIRPLESMNSILIATVAFGILLNLSAICIQILNSIKNKDYENLFFSSNGISGFVFYVLAIVIFVMVYVNNSVIPVWLIEVLVGVPILLIALKQPLGNLITGKKKLIHGSIGEYIMETFFETFEILLSFVTNTISFVRVGAFALCHAGMMSVVLMLAGASHDSSGNIVIMIFGNIFVMCLEGLIVGIQVLRLQYYEMFSRFFKGDGKAFKSSIKPNIKK